MRAAISSLNVYILLVALLVASVALSYVDLGRMNFLAALAIGAAKAALILTFFMELRAQLPAARIMLATVVIWSVIFAALALSDYTTRSWPVGSVVTYDAPVGRGLTDAPMRVEAPDMP
jgi:cytochrome c oxidase subunit 4